MHRTLRRSARKADPTEDLTDVMRQVEAFLRESEKRLNLATTSAGAGLWAIEQTTRQIWLTDRTRQLLGLSDGKVLGTRI